MLLVQLKCEEDNLVVNLEVGVKPTIGDTIHVKGKSYIVDKVIWCIEEFPGQSGILAYIKREKDTSFEDNKQILINLEGEEMGAIIGKRGQTLDSLQYLTNLVVNKGEYAYMNVTIDTENYRVRRKETLEHLAFNLAKKAKHNRRNVTLEPMNPYERRIIHATLQNDRYVTTYSEGVEPFRYVVIALKNNYSSRKRYNNRPQERNNTTETTEE